MKRPKEEKSVASIKLFRILSNDDKDCIDEGLSDYNSSISILSDEEGDKGDKDKRQEKEKGQKNVSEKRGKKCKQKFRYLEAVIDKILNRKSCSYFKECHFKI